MMSETVSICNPTSNKILEENIDSQNREVVLSLANDKEYLESYFDICRIYRIKRVILRKIENKRSKFEVSEKKGFDGRIGILNNRIKSLEAVFWKNVEKGQKHGVKFSIEEIFAKFNLDLFEKRLLLFFLYLEYFAIEKNLCMEDELLRIFDTENSVLFRMRNIRYFNSDATLIKKALLGKDYNTRGENARVKIGLSTKALNIVSTALNGGEISSMEADKTSNSETIGYVKEPEYRFDDIKLSEEIVEKVIFSLQTIKGNNLEKLGVSQKIKKGLGTAFLFYGPSGTGKSMLAEAVAEYVGKKVLVVEYPKIMGRYLGETDKNITRIFKSAEEENLVVLLDEADTLFYNRSFAMEEHDIRFVNEMLQELERFKGIVVLTTNMDVLIDPALERRLSLKIKFDFPSKDLRLKIWRSHLPDNIKMAEGINFEMLAAKYDFSGGNIKNAVLNAFRRMSSKNIETLTLDDLIFGANLEKEGMFSEKNRGKIVKGFSNY
ncbi:MAG: ATP-binding protein [Candidatus Omnitrophota bacterium]